jgi:hypothetical protein
MGAGPDAFWLRRNQDEQNQQTERIESPGGCGKLLLAFALASFAAAFMFAGSRRTMLPEAGINSHDLFLVSQDEAAGSSTLNLSGQNYARWQTRMSSLFAASAFYGAKHPISLGTGARELPLQSEAVSDNLGALLNVQLSQAQTETAGGEPASRVALSYLAWTKSFGADPELIGRRISIGGRPMVVAGILSNEAWQVTGKPDVWLLEDAAHLEGDSDPSRGSVVARLAESAKSAETRGHWHFSVQGRGAGTFDFIPVSDEIYTPWVTFLFTLLLACAALPATTPLPLGEYPSTDDPLFDERRWARWNFLLMKLALTTFTVYCLSTFFAFADPSISLNSSVYIQFSTSFLGLLFSFRWVLRDQRSRCPVCLRKLKNPVRVGHPSRNFLAWHGTELMCDRGHGLLHIPEMATSWFGTQRWLDLDPSWKSLFQESCLPPASIL